MRTTASRVPILPIMDQPIRASRSQETTFEVHGHGSCPVEEDVAIVVGVLDQHAPQPSDAVENASNFGSSLKKKLFKLGLSDESVRFRPPSLEKTTLPALVGRPAEFVAQVRIELHVRLRADSNILAEACQVLDEHGVTELRVYQWSTDEAWGRANEKAIELAVANARGRANSYSAAFGISLSILSISDGGRSDGSMHEWRGIREEEHRGARPSPPQATCTVSVLCRTSEPSTPFGAGR